MKVTRIVILFLSWVSLSEGSRAQENVAPKDVPLSSGTTHIYSCIPGPWGNLEYYWLYLEAPESLVEPIATPSAQTIWRFPRKSVEEVRAILSQAGLSDDSIRTLLEDSLPFRVSDEIPLYPSDILVQSLSPESRAQIYAYLRLSERNPFHRAPLIIDSGSTADSLEGSGLDPQTISLIEDLVYPFAGGLAFSDLPFVISRIQADDRSERRLLRVMTRVKTLVVRLKVDRDTDFEQLKSYWTVGYKHKDVIPLLEAVARSSTTDSIDVAHLIPPTPRQLLYSYPHFGMGLDGVYPDSFWTALNFFEFHPRSEFKEPLAVSRYASQTYRPAAEPLEFGDLLVIVDLKTGAPLHAATFIAADIVYTKHGRSVLHPFVFSRWGDLLGRYRDATELKVEVWRKVPR